MEQEGAGSPLLDFDERDLFAWTEAAGFADVRLTLEVERHRHVPAPRAWETLLRSSGNPLSPTFGALVDATLSAAEAEALEAHLRPLVEAGDGAVPLACAYLTARVGA